MGLGAALAAVLAMWALVGWSWWARVLVAALAFILGFMSTGPERDDTPPAEPSAFIRGNVRSGRVVGNASTASTFIDGDVDDTDIEANRHDPPAGA